MNNGTGFLELRKIEAAKDIAETLSKSRFVFVEEGALCWDWAPCCRNVIYLPGGAGGSGGNQSPGILLNIQWKYFRPLSISFSFKVRLCLAAFVALHPLPPEIPEEFPGTFVSKANGTNNASFVTSIRSTKLENFVCGSQTISTMYFESFSCQAKYLQHGR